MAWPDLTGFTTRRRDLLDFADLQEPTGFADLPPPYGNTLEATSRARNLLGVPRIQNSLISRYINSDLLNPEGNPSFQLGQNLINERAKTTEEQLRTAFHRSGLDTSGASLKALLPFKRQGDLDIGNLALSTGINAENQAKAFEQLKQQGFAGEQGLSTIMYQLAEQRKHQKELLEMLSKQESGNLLGTVGPGLLSGLLFRKGESGGLLASIWPSIFGPEKKPGTDGGGVTTAAEQAAQAAAMQVIKQIWPSLFGGGSNISPDTLSWLSSLAANPEQGFPATGGLNLLTPELNPEWQFPQNLLNFSSPGAEAGSVGGSVPAEGLLSGMESGGPLTSTQGLFGLTPELNSWLGSLAASPELGFPAAGADLLGAEAGFSSFLAPLGLAGAFAAGVPLIMKLFGAGSAGPEWMKKAAGWINTAHQELQANPTAFLQKLGKFDGSVMMSRQAQGIDDNQLRISYPEAERIQQDLARRSFAGTLTANDIIAAYGVGEDRFSNETETGQMRGMLLRTISEGLHKGPNDPLNPIDLWMIGNGLNGQQGSIPSLLIDWEGMKAKRLEGAPEGATYKDEQGYWRNAEGQAWSDEEGGINPGLTGRWM